jgi:hypothetical protein
VAYGPVANTCYALSMEQKLRHSLKEMRAIMWRIDPLLNRDSVKSGRC